jgi:catechol 2,3-dioxygenase-like lactoylglutathione lyase family enzyme
MSETRSASVAELIESTHHTALCVEDFEAVRDFYVEMLGFTVQGEMERRDEPELGRVVGLPGAVIRWALLARDDHRIELLKYLEPEGSKDIRPQCDCGYTHMAFEVSDVDAACEKLVAAGYRTNSPPLPMRGGRARVVYVLAPEGNVTELMEFPPGPYDD